ncbi:MAG: Sua5/YciO/YrdC/YwlC family protein [Planctomycetaceae bacterium]
MPRKIAIENAADVDSAVSEAISHLNAGAVVVLPGTTSYVLASLQSKAAVHPEFFDAKTTQLAVLGAEAAGDLIPNMPDRLSRLLGRCWPGPLAVDVSADVGANVPQDVSADGTARIVAPEHAVVQQLLSLLPEPLVLVSPSDRVISCEQAGQVWPECELLLDAGPPTYDAGLSTVAVPDSGFEVVETGILSEQAIVLSACRIYLFVCTGNTCRSPLAEGLFRNLLGTRLECEPEALTDRGVLVQSAGLAAATGSAASSESVAILSRRGMDIGNHVSQPLTESLLEASDHIFTMTNSHRTAIVRFRADMADKVEVLRRDGDDVVDPIGGGMSEYERCEREIEESLLAIIDKHFPGAD